MQPVNRVEIIITSQEVQKIVNILEQAKIPGYSIINNVIGKSDFRNVSDDVNLGSSKLSNVFVICYCPQDQVKAIATQIKPILNKYGGVCYISDAMEIRSIHCVA